MSLAFRTGFCQTPLQLSSSVRTRHAGVARRMLTVKAVGWDPEGVLSAPKGGHITRRMMQKQVEQNKELAAEMETIKAQARKELQQKRETRKLPTSHAEVVDFLLDTETPEMEFEVARCRPMITTDFFEYLQRQITSERLSGSPNEERVAELSMLQQYLEEAVQAVDKAAETVVAPAERLRKLLSSQDKAATLYEMAGNNEVDAALIDLLQHNIDAAATAGNADAVKFMEKVRNAAQKFVIRA